MKNIDPIRDKVVAVLELEGLPHAVQNEALDAVVEEILAALSLALYERLPSDARPEFMKLSEAGDARAVETFLRNHLPGLKDIINEEVKKEILSFKQKMAGAPKPTYSA